MNKLKPSEHCRTIVCVCVCVSVYVCVSVCVCRVSGTVLFILCHVYGNTTIVFMFVIIFILMNILFVFTHVSMHEVIKYNKVVITT